MLRMIDWLAHAWLERRAAGAARQIEAETGVRMARAEASASGWRIDLAAPNLLFLLEEAAAILDHHKADNYIEFSMIPSARRGAEWRAVRVTLQWMHGKSPAEIAAELRAENQRLRQHIAEKEGANG